MNFDGKRFLQQQVDNRAFSNDEMKFQLNQQIVLYYDNNDLVLLSELQHYKTQTKGSSIGLIYQSDY